MTLLKSTVTIAGFEPGEVKEADENDPTVKVALEMGYLVRVPADSVSPAPAADAAAAGSSEGQEPASVTVSDAPDAPGDAGGGQVS